MAQKQELQAKLAAVITEERISFCASHSQLLRNPPPLRPYFYYHTMKTGGNSFIMPIISAYRFRHNFQMNNPTRCHGRFDDLLLDMELFKHEPPFFIASHHAYPLHDRLKSMNYGLLACLRDPIARVKSHYGYEIMRLGWEPDEEEYCDFIDDPEYQNIACKQFAGSGDIGESDEALLQRARAHLKTFDMVALVNNLDEYLTKFLTDQALPNVITGQLNRTLEKYRPNFPQYDADIAKANQLDMALYDDYKVQDIVIPDKDRPIHDISVLIYDLQDEEEAHFPSHFAPTDFLLSQLDECIKNAITYPDLKAFVAHEIKEKLDGITLDEIYKDDDTD